MLKFNSEEDSRPIKRRMTSKDEIEEGQEESQVSDIALLCVCRLRESDD